MIDVDPDGISFKNEFVFEFVPFPTVTALILMTTDHVPVESVISPDMLVIVVVVPDILLP